MELCLNSISFAFLVPNSSAQSRKPSVHSTGRAKLAKMSEPVETTEAERFWYREWTCGDWGRDYGHEIDRRLSRLDRLHQKTVRFNVSLLFFVVIHYEREVFNSVACFKYWLFEIWKSRILNWRFSFHNNYLLHLRKQVSEHSLSFFPIRLQLTLVPRLSK